LVLVFSDGSNKSQQVIREVGEAVEKGIPIIPLRIENVDPSQEMRYYIKSIHWLDAMTPPFERHLNKLSNSVQALLSVETDEKTTLETASEVRFPSQKRQPLPNWAKGLLALTVVAIVSGGAWLFSSTLSPSETSETGDLEVTSTLEDAAIITEPTPISTIESSTPTTSENTESTNKFNWYHNPVTDHYYSLTEPGMSWDMLEALAVQTGGHLVSINDAEEEEWLYSTFGSTMFWIGLTDYPDEGEYRWTSGEPATYLNWCPGEPTDTAGGAGTEDAVHAIPRAQCWNDEPTWITEFWDPDTQKNIPSYPGVIESEWRTLSFNIPSETLWRQSGENSYTIIAKPLTDTIAWSDEIITGDFILTAEVTHSSRRGAAMFIIYGDGIGFSHGCLMAHYGSTTDGDGWTAFEAHSIYEEGDILVSNFGDFYFYDATRFFTIEIIGGKANLYVDGQKVVSTILPSDINHAGRIGLIQHWEQPIGATYSNIRIKSLGDDE